MRYLIKTSFFVLLSITFLFGSEYGQIKGTVTDSVTGKSVADVGIFVDELNIHSVTDKYGNYLIDSIPGGSYTINFPTYCGSDVFSYNKTVVEVDSMSTITLDFKCRDEREELYRHAQLIRFGIQSHYHPSSDLPATTTNELITLMPGVTQSESGIHVRGGGADEVIYYIDGIQTKVPYMGWQYENLSLPAIQEVEVITGGFDAEYGNAQTGVVNIVTKQGSSLHYGMFSYLGDEMFSGDRSNYGYNQYNLALGGPLVINRLRYFLSGDFILTDASQGALYKIPSPKNDYDLLGNITYRIPNARGKLTISGLRARDQYVAWNPNSEPGNAYKYFDQRPMTRTKNWLAAASLEYMLTNKTRTTLNIGMTHVDQVFGNRDYEWEEENNQSWYGDYRLKAEHLIPYLAEDYLEANSLSVTDILLDSLIQYHTAYAYSSPEASRRSPYGVGLFYTIGDYPAWTYWQNNDFQAHLNLVQAVGRVHEFKTGIDYVRYDIKYYDNPIPWFSNSFWSYFERQPYQWAGYLQDNINWELLYARLGFRFDYLDPNREPFQYILDPGIIDTVDFEPSFKVSPRLGIALDLSERAKFYFNYGHYYQPAMPTFIDSSSVQKATIYEVGFERQLFNDFLVGINAYLKEMDDGRQVKGLECIINKRMSSMWAMAFSYNLQYAEGDNSWIGTWYYDHYGYEYLLPPQTIWLDQDQRHVIKTVLDFEFPKEFFLPLENLTSSMAVSYFSGLPYTAEDLAGNMLGDINAERMPGYWNVDWKVSRRIDIGPVNLVLTGLINNLFNSEQIVDVYNTTGLPDDHGDFEPGVDQFSAIALTSTYYSPQGDYNHDGLMSPAERQAEYISALHDKYADPTNYNNSFRLRLGIGIAF